jgi:hypothetical protein
MARSISGSTDACQVLLILGLNHQIKGKGARFCTAGKADLRSG